MSSVPPTLKFGSLLKDHPEVLRQSQRYPTTDISLWWDDKTFYRTLPPAFDGREAWQAYTCFPATQRCADSWAIVARDVLADRFTLGTGGEIALQLSDTEIVACIDTSPKAYLKGIDSANSLDYKDACQGYSIYDAWEYIYAYGIPESNCFSHKKLQNHIPSFKLPEEISFTEKKQIYGDQCKNIESDQHECIWKKDGLPVARRSFFSNAIFNISQYKLGPSGENSEFLLDKTVEAIKYELLRFGPVAAGFLVFENFVNGYHGTTIYQEAKGKPLGGHYVSIMGWDTDKTSGVNYWICRNSYGTDFGLTGFFKMKIGIKECMLEENVSTVAAYFYDLFNTDYPIDTLLNGKKIDVTDMKDINPALYEKRKKVDVDSATFYTKDTLKLVKEGKLYGSLEPLIENPKLLLPNQRFFWVEDFKNFKFINIEYQNKSSGNKQEDSKIFYLFLFVVACLGMVYLGYKRGSRK